MRHASKLIQQHFLRGLDPAETERLRSHLRSCETCRAEYDALAELLRLAAGRAPTRQENAQLRAAALAAISDSSPPAPAARGRGRLLTRLAPLLAAGCLVLATFGLARLLPQPQEQQVRFKGGAHAPALIDLQLFAVSRQGDGFTSPRPVADGHALGRRDYLQFGYLNGDPALSYLYLVGVDVRGRRLDYFPRPASGPSIPINHTLRLRSVGRSIHLARRHVPGPLWIYAFFSAQPLSPELIHEQLPPQAGATLPPALDLGPQVAAVSRWVLVEDTIPED